MTRHDDPQQSPDPAADPFDGLLLSATWPTASVDQVHRLQGQWRHQRSRVRRIRQATGAAAVILVAGLAILQFRAIRDTGSPGDGPAFRVAKRPVPVEPVPVESEAIGVPFESPEPGPENVVDSLGPSQPIQSSAEPASALESLLLASAQRHRLEGQRTISGTEQTEDLNDAIEALVTGKSTIAELQQSLAPQADRLETPLAYLALQSRGDRQAAAVQLLVALGTAQSAPVLLELRDLPNLRLAATAGIARVAPPILLARLAVHETDGESRKMLLAGLLSRNTREAVDLFLNFAANPQTQQPALDSLDAVAAAPVELLVETLRSPKVSRRIIAARVLGGLRDPAVGQRLIAMALQGESRREALIALLSSTDPNAANFVNRSRHDPAWAAQLQAAASDAQPLTVRYQET